MPETRERLSHITIALHWLVAAAIIAMIPFGLYVEDLPPWAEFDWLGRELTAGDARLHVAERIDRCAATNVDPSNGVRDLNVPLSLRQIYGHIDCGVLVRVTRGGTLEVGQTLAL